MNREAFLERVRAATAAGRQFRLHVEDIPREAGYVGAGDDHLARLATEVDAVGGHAFRATDDEAARIHLRELLTTYQCRMALCWEHPLLERLQLPELLAEQHAQHLSYAGLSALPAARRREQMLAADVCISSVSFAVAETGTAVVCSGPGQERSGSLLAPVHIAVVERSQVLPDLFDLFDRLAADEMPSNVSLITGPSKSGDIELQLTTGVHGPGKWHVVVIGED